METKTCFKCNQNLPLSSFYAQNGMKDGHLNKCKECTKKDTRQYSHSDAGIVKKRKWASDWKKRNRRKDCANFLAQEALRKGKIQKKPCCVCGSENVQAHHENYDFPLDVVWYCPQHHADRHSEIRKNERKF